MGRKKKENVRQYFSKNKNGIECNFCKLNYKAENVTKMGKHLISCMHCPQNIKSKLDGKQISGMETFEKQNDTIDSNLSDTTFSTASSSTARSSTPMSSRPSSPFFSRVSSFLDRMTEKENVNFQLKCRIKLSLHDLFSFFRMSSMECWLRPFSFRVHLYPWSNIHFGLNSSRNCDLHLNCQNEHTFPQLYWKKNTML